MENSPIHWPARLIMNTTPAILDLQQLHQDIDAKSAQLSSIHAQRLQCRRGCTMCCVDDITVYEIEAENIRRHHRVLLETAQPHPPGACAFLDDGACRIYEHRPYVCRTQGLPLRWFETPPDGSTVEMRDICPLNEASEPLESLDADDCWTIGPVESSLAQIQAAQDGEPLRRVPLRDLFR